jgi:hypothetical protein
LTRSYSFTSFFESDVVDNFVFYDELFSFPSGAFFIEACVWAVAVGAFRRVATVFAIVSFLAANWAGWGFLPALAAMVPKLLTLEASKWVWDVRFNLNSSISDFHSAGQFE